MPSKPVPGPVSQHVKKARADVSDLPFSVHQRDCHEAMFDQGTVARLTVYPDTGRATTLLEPWAVANVCR